MPSRSLTKYWTLLFFLIFSACGSGEGEQAHSHAAGHEQAAHPSNSTDSATVPEDDTRKLIQEAHAKIEPLGNTTVLNKVRAGLFKAKVDSSKGIDHFNAIMEYAMELLHAGENTEALKVLNEITEIAQKNGSWNQVSIWQRVKTAKAITYMRIGESENCIQNHNHDSCIIPVQDKGIHELDFGSSWAIKETMDILKQSPKDFRSIWLLNLAHMTLGSYPDEVPEEYLIPPKYFEQHKDVFPTFENIATKIGIGDHRLSGASIFDDFDNDGDLDLVCSSWGLNDGLKYYENQEGAFVDRSKDNGLDTYHGGLNIVQTDYNNDGLLDIYVMRGAWLEKDGAVPNTLLKNIGGGKFEDVTIDVGILYPAPTQATAWSDFNRDGWLDLLVVHESLPDKIHPIKLWLSNGDGTFTDVAPKARLSHIGYFKGVSVGDLNNDGWPDIYVSNLGKNNLLYWNQGVKNGQLTFKQDGQGAGVINPQGSFPSSIFDYNNDGFNDILVSSYSSHGTRPAECFCQNVFLNQKAGGTTALYLNRGDETFENVSDKFLLNECMWVMGTNYGDIDNDGWIDMYFGTGDPSFYSVIPNKMYRNLEGKGIMDVTYAGGFGHIQKGHGVSMADVDRDGDLDVYVVMGGAFEGDAFQNAFFENPGNENNWIVLQFEGTSANKKGIGARVKLTFVENGKERVVHRTVGSGSSFGANSLEMEIGLGKASEIKSLEIEWPSEVFVKQTLKHFEVNQYYLVKQQSILPKKLNRKPTKFQASKGGHHHH